MTAIRARQHLVLRPRHRVAEERALQRAAENGDMTRLRCGAYVPTRVWSALDDLERRRLEAAAAAEKDADFMASHRSAAALWNPPTLRPGGRLVHKRTSAAAGTRTEHGMRKHAVADLDLHRASVEGVPCTSLERTVLDLAATEPFEEAVVAADAALRVGTTEDLLRACLDEWDPGRGRRRIEGVIDFADPASGSVGESWSRVQIHDGRLPVPVLQQAFFDADGLIGRVDFWWPDQNRIGEFDGMKKYREAELLRGRSPGEVVEAEKLREDRLRASEGRPSVDRWVWQVLVDRDLARRLRTTGLR